MTTRFDAGRLAGTALAMTLLASVPAMAKMSAEELAKLAQNPVGNLISIPFQNNTNLNYGPEGGTQNILNIQPVIPISINKDWNIITRTIVPVIWMPSLGPGIDSTTGVGDTVFTAFLSPANPGKLIWGAGKDSFLKDPPTQPCPSWRIRAWSMPWWSSATLCWRTMH